MAGNQTEESSARPVANVDDPLMSSEEVAAYLQVSHAHVKNMANDRRLPMFKCGVRWRMRRSTLLRWIEEQEQASSVA